MKIIKKISLIVFVMVLMLTITGCKKEKTFTKAGITVTLDSSFHESQNINLEVVYLSSKFGFGANGETKTSLVTVDTLDKYMNAVLVNANRKDSTVEKYEVDGEVSFLYTIYDAKVESRDFTYLVLAKEGKDKYYIINFWCLKNSFNDKTKEKMFNWAKSIKVE